MLEQRIKATFGQYQVPAVVHAVQGDTGRIFIFESQDRQLTGNETAALMCIRPNGTAFSYSGTIDAALNEITVDLDVDGGALSQAGVVAAQLVLQESGLVLCSFKLGIIVEEVLGGVASPDDITFLAGLQAQLDSWIAAAATVYVPKTDGFVNGKSLPAELYVQDVPSKNLLNPQIATAPTGITYTVSTDGKITFSGSVSSNVTWKIGVLDSSYSGQNMILSGCATGGGTSGYSLRVYNGGAVVATDNGDGTAFTAASDTTVYIRLATGVTYSNVTFKPMVRLASITDDTYVPYAKTNVELTQETNTEVFEIKAVSGVTIKRNGSRYINSKTVHIMCRLQITSAISNAKIIEFQKQATGVGIVIPIFSSTAEWGAPDVIQYGYVGAVDVVGTLSTSYPYVTIDTIIDLV